MLNFSLHRNHLMNGSTTYRAVVQSQGTLDLQQLIERMVRHGSTVTEPDAAAALSNFFFVAEDALIDGHRIATPFGTLWLSIRGSFEDETEGFDPDRHHVELILSPSAEFRSKLAQRAQVRRRRASTPQPKVSRYKNPNNGEEPTSLSPGGGAHLYGELLNFDPDDPNQGIFILPVNGNAPVNGDDGSIRVETVLRNSSRELAFLVPPQLTTGDYTIEVRGLFGKEDIRTGALKEILEVE